jgi:hypothetical protein
MNPNPRRPAAFIPAFAAAALATVATIGSVLALFDSAASTPWLAADQASRIAHCDGLRATTQRQACVRAALAEPALRVAVR